MESMIERVGERLRKECLEVFGSTWSNDVAWRFARAAIEEMRLHTEAMELAGDEHADRGAVVWMAMIDASLKEEEEKAV